jgi:ADP-ribosylglycohydrolase
MWGAIIGDVVGSRFEFAPTDSQDFEAFSTKSAFTDDSILTVATADAIRNKRDFAEAYKAWGRAYPDGGYGGMFRRWLHSDDMGPYNSFGNGAAMRVSPAAYISSQRQAILECAETSAAVTHNHPEGIKGAQAAALATYLALQGSPQQEIQAELEALFPSYDLRRRWEDIQPGYSFNETCQGTVPEALICFLQSDSYEATIRKAVALGGDADTLACIAGGVAGAYFGVPEDWLSEAKSRLSGEMIAVVEDFLNKYSAP